MLFPWFFYIVCKKSSSYVFFPLFIAFTYKCIYFIFVLYHVYYISYILYIIYYYINILIILVYNVAVYICKCTILTIFMCTFIHLTVQFSPTSTSRHVSNSQTETFHTFKKIIFFTLLNLAMTLCYEKLKPTI
jgi:hypothetical protein